MGIIIRITKRIKLIYKTYLVPIKWIILIILILIPFLILIIFSIDLALVSGLFALLFGIYVPRLLDNIKKTIEKEEEESSKNNIYKLFEDYKQTSVAKRLLKYIYLDTNNNLNNLENLFFKSDNQISILMGNGGSGKTRLALEFANLVVKKYQWDVRFIDTNSNINMALPDENNLLLIIDDASRYVLLNELINKVKYSNKNVKLLLVDRPIVNTILSEPTYGNQLSKLQVINIKYTFGDIEKFLKENLNIQDETITKSIELKCEKNYCYAIVHAEYYKKHGNIGNLKEAIYDKLEIYINDIVLSTKLSIDDVKQSLYIISLTYPDWEIDYKYYNKILKAYPHLYDNISKIISKSRFSKDSEILIIDNGKCIIKPDLIADFIRLEFMLNNDNLFKFTINNFMPYMPFRLISNIDSIQKFDKNNSEKLNNYINTIWIELNTNNGLLPEYFSAISFYLRAYIKEPFCNTDIVNIDLWVKNYYILSKTNPKRKLKDDLLFCLSYLMIYYTNEDSKKYEYIYDTFKTIFNEKLDNPKDDYELKKWLGLALSIKFMYYFGAKSALISDRFNENLKDSPMQVKNLTKLIDCLSELKIYYNEYKNVDSANALMMCLSFTTCYYLFSNQFSEMNNCFKELEAIYIENKEKDKHQALKLWYVDTLLYVIMGSDKYNDNKALESYLDKISIEYDECSGSDPFKKYAAEKLAMCLTCTINYYIRNGKLIIAENYLNELEQLFIQETLYPIFKLYISSLYHILIGYLKVNNNSKTLFYVNKLKQLEKGRSENEIKTCLVVSLAQTIHLLDSSGNEYYSNLALLFKLRQYLPESSTKFDSIINIEKQFVNLTIQNITKQKLEPENLYKFTAWLTNIVGAECVKDVLERINTKTNNM